MDFADARRLYAAGTASDFFLRSNDGAVHHYRDGNWVLDGVTGVADDVQNQVSRPDQFRTFADGTVAFLTSIPEESRRISYIFTGSCWASIEDERATSAHILQRDGMSTFAYLDAFDDLCLLPNEIDAP